MSETITVTGLGKPYDVVVQAGLLAEVGECVRQVAPAKQAVVVTNDVVWPLFEQVVTASLEAADFSVVPTVVKDGERYKTVDTLAEVYEAVLPKQIDRRTPVIGLGGGVATDLAGFAAATLLRGLPYVAVPTSLLAIVDASVGGKTGVNHAVGKNLVGAFYPASLVLIDPATLATLPERELRGGLAECVKHDVIGDAEHLATMEQQAEAYLSRDAEALAELVSHNVRVKASVVAEDPYEQGVRAHLNLGHTFGHAFEKVSDYAMSHGEAVAAGTVVACRLSADLGMMSAEEAKRVESLIQSLGLPTKIDPALDVDAILSAMQSDKKVRDGKIRLVLPTRLGAATVRDDVDDDLIRRVVTAASA
ncbi:MAG: 3-dehydroquinate synthase [Planctomycetota bacterium]